MGIRSSLVCLVTFLLVGFFGHVRAQEDTSFLLLKNGKSKPGNVQVLRYADGDRLRAFILDERVYSPVEVRGYRTGSGYYGVLEETERVVRKTRTGDRRRVEVSQYRPVKRYVQGTLNLYSTELDENHASPPYEYFNVGDGGLREVNYENLRDVMGSGESASRLDRARRWRNSGNAAFFTGLALTGWGLFRGGRNNESQSWGLLVVGSSSSIHFTVTVSLVSGVASLLGSYLFDRKAKSVFWNSIQQFGSSDPGTSTTSPTQRPPE